MNATNQGSVHILWDANLSSQSQANQITSTMGFTPNPYNQAPGGYPAAPQPGGYGASSPNQQPYGLYPQPGGQMPQPQGPGMGYPGQPGQPMPGYPRAPSPNPSMPGYGGGPAPNPSMPGYPRAPSPNPSMPGYGGGAMPVAPAINVRNAGKQSHRYEERTILCVKTKYLMKNISKFQVMEFMVQSTLWK